MSGVVWQLTTHVTQLQVTYCVIILITQSHHPPSPTSVPTQTPNVTQQSADLQHSTNFTNLECKNETEIKFFLRDVCYQVLCLNAR